MDNENSTMFKNAIGGYRKKEVNDYIASLAQDAIRREARFEQEKGKLTRAAAEKEEEAKQLAAMRDELACSLFEAEEKSKAALSALAERETAMKAAEQAAAEKEKVFSELAERVALLESALAEKEAALAERDKQAEQDSTRLEELNTKVEKVMSAASASAKEIVESALRRAEEIVSEAERESASIRREAAITSDALTEKAKGTYETAASYYDGVTRFAEELRGSLDSLMKEINEKKTDVTSKIEWLKIAEASSVPQKAEDGEGGEKSASLDERIEEFFRNTISAIRKMTGKEKGDLS